MLLLKNLKLSAIDKPVHAPYIPPDIDESDEKFFEALEKGEHFDKLTHCKVEVSGPNAPKDPIQRWAR